MRESENVGAYDLTNKRSRTQKSHQKMLNSRDIIGNAEEEKSHKFVGGFLFDIVYC